MRILVFGAGAIGSIYGSFLSLANNDVVHYVMELHNNPDDLYELCTDVYQSARSLSVKTPLFDQKSEYFLGKG